MHVHGDVDEGFGAVADAFRRNFDQHGEIGAAVAVYEGDRLVVDLWGGYRDRRRTQPWERDTMVPVFSSTKGMAAFVLAMLVSAGHLDYDEPVVTYWPEFAAHGKEQVTVKQLLDHQAGLPTIDQRLTLTDILDLDKVAAALAAQRPYWRPGTAHGYHSISLGLYEGELARRADPRHRSLGRYFADEIATPLDVDFFIGLPDDVDTAALATPIPATPVAAVRYERDLNVRFGASLVLPSSLARKSLRNPAINPFRTTGREFLAPELPGSNGVGTARGLARVYGAAAARTGELLITPDVLDQLGREVPPSVPGHDRVLQVHSNYHLGFRKPSRSIRFGSDGRAYGTTGMGGSFGFADPTTGFGFAYVMNRLGMSIMSDIRCRKLYRAVFAPTS